MSEYTDYILYSEVDIAEVVQATFNTYISTNRDNKYLYLARTKHAVTIPTEATLLATGHCLVDCPFAKLTGDNLDKYKMAYQTEPYLTDELQEVVPPFKFGVFQ